MSKLRFWALLASVLGCVLLAAEVASACECLGIDEYFVSCNGCIHDYYTLQFCGGDGCIYGEDCYVSGYGKCCQTSYMTYNIDTDDCDPFYVCDECSDARSHAASHARGPTRVGSTPEAFPTEAVLAPNRCTGAYAAVLPVAVGIAKPAISSQANAPRKGGL